MRDPEDLDADRFLIAPVGATQYELGWGPAILGRKLQLVGYGLTGTGETGLQRGTGGIKRSGLITLDLIGRMIDLFQLESQAGGPQLAFDFDSGDTKHDTFSSHPYNNPHLGLGRDESFLSKGDSGGLWIDLATNSILGVFRAYGTPDGGSIKFGTGKFGDMATGISVHHYRDWIRSVTQPADAKPMHVVLDMKYQPLGASIDGENVEIRVFQTDRGTLRIEGKLASEGNYKPFYEAPISRISALTIRGSSDRETIAIDGPLHFAAAAGGESGLTIDGRGHDDTIILRRFGRQESIANRDASIRVLGGEGKDTLFFTEGVVQPTDEGLGGVETVISDREFTSTRDGRRHTVQFDGFEDLHFAGSRWADTVDLLGEVKNTEITIDTWDGNDTVRVYRVEATSSVKVTAGDGNDTVLVRGCSVSFRLPGSGSGTPARVRSSD